MTAEEHIVAWIESSQPEYRRLIELSTIAYELSNSGRAHRALSLASDAYRQMVKGGDAYASDHDASTILGAAVMLANWKPE